MRQLFTCLLFALFLSSCTSAPDEFIHALPPTDENLNVGLTPRDDDYLKGNVKSVQVIEEEDSTNDCWHFDLDGHCLESVHYGVGDVHTHTYYSYDGQGRRVKSISHVSGDRGKGTIVSDYSYSANGRRCKGRTSCSDSLFKTKDVRFRYNRYGKLTSWIFYDGSRISYRYNKQGQLAKTIWLDGTEIVQNPDDTVPYSAIYDSLGRAIVKDYANEPARVLYRYDTAGNWIERQTLPLGGITIRNIEYY